MSGNSKVIGVTMSRSGCEEHGAAATQLCDPGLQETRGATVHWSVQSLCQSHHITFVCLEHEIQTTCCICII